MSKLGILGATVSIFALSGTAEAKLLSYTLTGTDYDGAVEYSHWYLDSNPTVSLCDVSNCFEIDSVAGYYSYGGTLFGTVNDLFFYSSTASFYYGGLFPSNYGGIADTLNVVDLISPKLFSGSLTAPTMLTGEFTVYDYFSSNPSGLTALHLSVQAVPEPASWMTMIAGFGMIGGAMRSRRSRIGYAKA